MKESFEDRMTKRIKEVMEKYEPKYSPQYWEEFRKQIPVLEFWLKRVFLSYRYWFTGTAIISVFFIVFRFLLPPALEKENAVIPLNSDSANYLESEKTKEKSCFDKSAPLSYVDSEAGTIHKKGNISSGYLPAPINDSLPTIYGNNTLIGNTSPEMLDIIEKKTAGSDLLISKGFGNKYTNIQLIPIKSQVEEIPVLKSPSSDRIRKLKFQWTEFNTIKTESKSYNKFVGPNKFAIFYSPEIHHTDSLKTFGISHGVGISLEGPIRSSFSISVGLSYQSMNFHKTIFSEKIPPHDSQISIDSIDISQYIDSIGIRSGNYKFLELPVSINFKFFESTGSQVWLSAGISSIAFLSQNYTSETIVGGVSDVVSSSAKAWENIHPLASLNISVFYRYKLNDWLFLHSSIQYKHHLVPLGYNSMKLNRLNFQVGLLYRFGREE
jgi:hypothetical protein